MFSRADGTYWDWKSGIQIINFRFGMDCSLSPVRSHCHQACRITYFVQMCRWISLYHLCATGMTGPSNSHKDISYITLDMDWFISCLGAEPGPVLRHPTCSSVRVLRLPLPGGCGRLAALWPPVRAQTHLCVWHSYSVAGRHWQPTWIRATRYVLRPTLPPAGAHGPFVKHHKTLFSVLTGAMYPTSMRINEEGRLVVNFKTEARFRGQFVMSHPGKRVAPTHTHMYTHMP